MTGSLSIAGLTAWQVSNLGFLYLRNPSSVSKQFTAAAVVLAAEKGLLVLDEDG